MKERKRITKRDDSGYRDGYVMFNVSDAYANQMYHKLRDLEDIEDELGIDLVTLFKALKQGGVYVKERFAGDTKIKMHSFEICGDSNGISIWS